MPNLLSGTKVHLKTIAAILKNVWRYKKSKLYPVKYLEHMLLLELLYLQLF